MALWLQDLESAPVSTNRRGRIGWWLGIAGTGLLALFAVQAGVSMVRTGEVPETFLLFLLGFLFLIVGQVPFARELRHHVGWAWLLPLVAVGGSRRRAVEPGATTRRTR